jgi:1,2-diacylglycerol 3-beta-glucosyltransferase
MVVGGLAAVLLAAAAAPVVVAWSYLAVLTLAAFAHERNRAEAGSRRPRLTVLIPAHNEAQLIARTVGSLKCQSYPAAQVVVIADNCSDSTALEATTAGARVLARDDSAHPGKGRALRWAIDLLLGEPEPPDGLVIVDADSEADPGLLEAFAAALAEGVELAQADYTVMAESDGRGDRLRALAVLLFNRTRNRGRAALGLPASLLGNGMLLSREFLTLHPWDSFSSVEDLEFATRRRIDGARPRFVAGHGVKGPLPLGYRAAVGQRLRWEGGRFYVLRLLGPSLLARFARRPDLATLDALLDLAVPPVWILFLITLSGFSVSLVASLALGLGAAAAAVWAACLGLAVLHVGLGARAADAPPGTTAALLGLPGFLVWKVGVYARLLRGFDPYRWQRSVRKGEVEWP